MYWYTSSKLYVSLTLVANILEKNAFTLCDLYGHALAQDSCSRGHEICLSLLYIQLVFSIYSQWRKTIQRSTSILRINPKLSPLMVVGGVGLQILISNLYSYRCYIPGEDWFSSSWEKDVNGRRTTCHDDDDRLPMAIGHLRDLGDYKCTWKTG